MSETKKIVIQQNNGTDYDKLYPQVDAYSKSETLTNNTSQMFRINNGTPEDVMQYLGKYAQYWWKVTKPSHYHQIKTKSSGVWVAITVVQTIDIYYGDTVTNSGENTQIVNQLVRGSRWDNFNTQCADIKGKYWQVKKSSGITSNGDVIYVPSNASLSVTTTGGDNWNWIISEFEIITYKYMEAQFVNYVQSNNRNAYPDSGEQDGYDYTYLGVPLANAALLKISDKI